MRLVYRTVARVCQTSSFPCNFRPLFGLIPYTGIHARLLKIVSLHRWLTLQLYDHNKFQKSIHINSNQWHRKRLIFQQLTGPWQHDTHFGCCLLHCMYFPTGELFMSAGCRRLMKLVFSLCCQSGKVTTHLTTCSKSTYGKSSCHCCNLQASRSLHFVKSVLHCVFGLDNVSTWQCADFLFTITLPSVYESS